MSAFVVSPQHITAMIARGIYLGQHARVSWDEMPQGRRKELDLCTATATGAMLLTANVRSVQDRYPEQDLAAHADNHLPPEAEEYRYNHHQPKPAAIEALKLLESFEHQANEPDDWEQSEAFRFCRALRLQLIHQLPGYDEARWSI